MTNHVYRLSAQQRDLTVELLERAIDDIEASPEYAAIREYDPSFAKAQDDYLASAKSIKELFEGNGNV